MRVAHMHVIWFLAHILYFSVWQRANVPYFNYEMNKLLWVLNLLHSIKFWDELNSYCAPGKKIYRDIRCPQYTASRVSATEVIRNMYQLLNVPIDQGICSSIKGCIFIRFSCWYRCAQAIRIEFMPSMSHSIAQTIRIEFTNKRIKEPLQLKILPFLNFFFWIV